ncbi:MAG TPA: CHAD domain-containing protein [Acidimicrobiales bacterium]|nr:CHAD domain-containing protein [Acidimicrobiales bacterium]
MQHLEQEVKLEVGPGWSLPDLAGLLPGAHAVHLAPLALDATYYDTPDRRLDAQHVTLRYREERELPDEAGTRPARAARAKSLARDAVAASAARSGTSGALARTWTVKLPTEVSGSTLARNEVNWELGVDRRPAGRRPARASAPVSPPPETAQLVSGITLGNPLVPIARLETLRRRAQLRTSDGRTLAEIAHDTVTGTTLAGQAGRRPRPSAPVTFTEVEVELAEGSALEVLDAIAGRLIGAGARRSERRSKLATVLSAVATEPAGAGGSAPAPDGKPPTRGAASSSPRADEQLRPQPGAPAGVSPPPLAPAVRNGRSRRAAVKAPGRAPSMADVLAQQAAACLATVLEHDPPIRLGDPDVEHVHRSRVAVRRLRSVMRAFGPLIDAGADDVASDPAEAWLARVGAELRWLGEALGAVRDADVRELSLETMTAELAGADQSGAATVLAAARDDQREARQRLLDVMASQRYMACLRLLEAFGQPPRGPSTQVGSRATSTSAALGHVPEAGAGRISTRPTGLTVVHDGAAGADASRAPAVAARGAHGRAGTAGGDGAGTTAEVPAVLWERLGGTAYVVLPELAGRQWRSLSKSVRRLGEQPSDDALHRVRIKAKRLRYIAEVAAPLLARAGDRRAAERTAKAAVELQDILGDLHDAAVNEQWLRAAAARPPQASGPARWRTGVATALAAGQLIALGVAVQREKRRTWRSAWAQLSAKRTTSWAEQRKVGKRK